MKISKKGQYALISVADLAIHSTNGHESIANIAKRQSIDPRYLGQIFFALKNAKIISSVRGKNGGYYLSRNPSGITAGEIIRAIEGSLSPTKCSATDKAAKCCETYDSCITRNLWQTIAFEINSTLNSVSIADIIKEYKKGSEYDEFK